MRTIYQRTKPRCDNCLENYDVVFDGPSVHGPWMYACEGCAHEALQRRATRIECRPKPPADDSAAALVGIKGIRDSPYIKCPKCKHQHSVELNADYTIECDGCGKWLKVVPII